MGGGSDALLALQVIDGSNVVGPVTLNHLKKLKDLYGIVRDFSKFVKIGPVDPGAGGPGANAVTWTISASTAPTTQWAGLEKLIGMVIQRAETEPIGGANLINFINGEFIGTLLASEGVVYAITGSPTDSNCVPVIDALNCSGGPLTTIINSVAYRTLNHHIYEAQAFNLFAVDNAKTVVGNALGAVNVYDLLDKIQKRPARESIRESLRRGGYVNLYVRNRSSKSWKLVETGGVVRSREAENVRGIAENLEKLRIRLAKNDMQEYRAPLTIPADDRFAMLKLIAERLDNVLSGNDFAPGFPTTFIERLNALTTSLRGETPGAYPVSEWNLRVESYRQRFSDFAGIITGYATGWFMKLNAAVRAGILAGEGELTVTGAGTGNADAPRPLPPAELQFAAGMLSTLAGIGGQLDWVRIRGDVIPERELRYAFATRGVRVNGKKCFLMIVKIKERGNNSVYAARVVDNGIPWQHGTLDMNK